MSNANQTFMRQLFAVKPYIVVLGIFFFYLLVIPELVKLITPCLHHIPGQSFKPNDCVVSTALDRFMTLALIGFVLGILITYFYSIPRSLKFIVVTASLMALCIIVNYYWYIPRVERVIRSAAVVLYEEK